MEVIKIIVLGGLENINIFKVIRQIVRVGKVIFYFGGGNMRCIYGAGVVKGISQRMPLPELFEKTREFVVGSGGGINVAGLVAAQADTPGRVCMEDLQKGFVSYSGAINRILRGFGGKIGLNWAVNSAPNCVNIDYLMDVLKNKRKLNSKKIKSCPVPIMMKLFEVNKNKIIYEDMRRNPFKTIKQGVSLIPYYSFSGHLVDGEIFEPLDVDYLLSKKQKGDKIVVVLNYPPGNGIKHLVKNWLERNVAGDISPKFAEQFVKKDRIFEEQVERLKRIIGKDVLFVYPDKSDPTRSRTTDSKTLKITYEMGIRDAERIEDFVRKSIN